MCSGHHGAGGSDGMVVSGPAAPLTLQVIEVKRIEVTMGSAGVGAIASMVGAMGARRLDPLRAICTAGN